METQKTIIPSPQLNDEEILVVPTVRLFPFDPPQGLIAQELDAYQMLIRNEQRFIWRSHAEIDPSYKQIIPYLLFHHQDRIFVMQRKKTASESRLKSKFSLGIGGHVRLEDLKRGNSLAQWAEREFHEEVDYQGNLSIKPIGLINDDSNDVGKVHVGFAMLLTGDSDAITIRNEHAHGALMSISECARLYDKMETWSQYLFNYIKANKELIA
jgi:predicted NUDIX family phosphoesterase